MLLLLPFVILNFTKTQMENHMASQLHDISWDLTDGKKP